MASTTHMATVEDDRRHLPGPNALPLWSESYWFPLYDPEREIGVVLRAGMYMKRGDANLYLFVTHAGAIVHAVTEHARRAAAARRRQLHGRRAARRHRAAARALPAALRARRRRPSTSRGRASSPAYKYPTPPSDEFPGHIEQGGRVTGRSRSAACRCRSTASGHRDHSWGGERDWTKFHRWTYLSGEFGADVWFNAVRIDLGEQVDIRIGCLWDGRELLSLQEIEIEPRTVEGGARQTGVDGAPHRRARARASHRRRGDRRQLSRPGWVARC